MALTRDLMHQARWEGSNEDEMSALDCCLAGGRLRPITAAFDGAYKGNGYSISPPGWDCPSVQPAETLTVSGGYATIADLRGWVAPSGVAHCRRRSPSCRVNSRAVTSRAGCNSMSVGQTA
jgi:hypothetical protein